MILYINVMRKGTSTVRTTPLNIDTTAYSFPEYRAIMGSDVSMDVAPPEAMGASLPKYFTRSGVAMRVNISLEIFESRAITPRVSFLIFEIINFFIRKP